MVQQKGDSRHEEHARDDEDLIQMVRLVWHP
jgi:hypothetical protein